MSMRGASPVVELRAKGVALSKFRGAAKKLIRRIPSVRRVSEISALRSKTQTEMFMDGGAKELMRARDDEMVHAWSMSARKREFDLEETVAMMATLGFDFPREDSEKMFHRMDADKNETLGATEVLLFLDAYDREGWTHHHDPYGGMAYHCKAGDPGVDGKAGGAEHFVWGGAGLGGDDSKFKNEYAARLQFKSKASLMDLKRSGTVTEATQLVPGKQGLPAEARSASTRTEGIEARVAVRALRTETTSTVTFCANPAHHLTCSP